MHRNNNRPTPAAQFASPLPESDSRGAEPFQCSGADPALSPKTSRSFLTAVFKPIFEIHKRVFRPKPLLQFFASHNLPRVFGKHAQQSQRQVLDLDAAAIFAKLSSGEVCLVGTEGE